jgi:hypothetical protein
MTRDPERLSRASDDPLLRELVDRGRSELPDEKQLESVLAKLGPVIGGPGGGGGGQGGSFGPHAPTTGAAWFGGAKVLSMVVAVSAAAWWVNVHYRTDGPETRPHAAVTAPAVSVALAASAPVVAPADDADPAGLDVPLPSAAPAPATAERVKEAPSASAGLPKPRIVPSVRDSDAELDLLKRAQDALLENPARALALADEDVRRFPDGLLRQEAEVIAIDALAHLGRRDQAVARAKKFRAAYPASTHLRRIDAILAP